MSVCVSNHNTAPKLTDLYQNLGLIRLCTKGKWLNVARSMCMGRAEPGEAERQTLDPCVYAHIPLDTEQPNVAQQPIKGGA